MSDTEIFLQPPYLFTESDRHNAQLLVDLGMPRNLARTVLYLSRRQEAISPHIESGTGLKQPEVSIAIGRLRQNGWIDQRNVKRAGKGRPTHVYSLNVPVATVLGQLEGQNRERIAAIEDNITRLKDITEDYTI